MGKAAIFLAGAAIGAISYFAIKKFKQSLTKSSPTSEKVTSGKTVIRKFDESKQYSILFVIRKDLKMKNGKISAQVGHASLGIFMKLQKHFPELSDHKFEKELFYCQDAEVQNQKASLAKQNGLRTCLIHDAGRTQIEAGSATVLAIAPVDSEMIGVFTEGLTPIPKK